jgi:subtilisin family serine protease
MPVRSICRILVLLAFAASTTLAFAAQAGAASGEGRYIVVLKDSVAHPGAVAEDQAEEVDGDVGLVYRSALRGYAATLPRDEVETLEEDPRVAYVTPDRKVELLSQATPTGVERVYAPENSSLQIDGIDNLRVNADVAVIDTGIDYTHPDLNVVARADCVPGSGKDEPPTCVDNSGTDDYGHGTHVAGIVGALDNGEGTVGVAPGARLWAVKVLAGGTGYESWITGGVDWVTAHASQIEVANMSLGCNCAMPALEKAINASINAGVVYTIAAGNLGIDAKYFSPASDPAAITVSALADYDGNPGGAAEPTCTAGYGTDDTLATFSNFGAGVDVAAPGVCIRSTAPIGGSPLFPEPEGEPEEGAPAPDPGYGTISGTSMAAPHVAGAAAILAAKSNPNSQADVEAIRQTIVEEGNSGWTDTSKDGSKEPLLDVGDGAVFSLVAPETKAASGVGLTEAVLHGVAKPKGVATTYQFEYGTTTGYGSKAPASAKSVGSGSSDVTVSETVTGLKSNTTYHFRLATFNTSGRATGEDLTFTTPPAPPVVKTEAPKETILRAAGMIGKVNPEGIATTYQLEYGTTTGYGSKAPVSPQGIGSGASDVPVFEWVGGLQPGTTYHYRVVATNAAGTTYGKDVEFVTTHAAFWGWAKLVGPLGTMECSVSGKANLNAGTLAEGTLTELHFEGCYSWNIWLQNCQPETAIEGGYFSDDPEASTILIDELRLTMTNHGGSCYSANIPFHISGSLGGEFFGGEEESEVVLDGGDLRYEDFIIPEAPLTIEGTIYFEEGPQL